jgi:selenide,water dikinase
VIEYDKVPRIAGVDYYIKQECIPGGTNRNFSSYGHKVSPMTGDQRALLCDPQTSGGLLLAVEKDMAAEFEKFAVSEGVTLTEIGYFVKKEGQYQIEVV